MNDYLIGLPIKTLDNLKPGSINFQTAWHAVFQRFGNLLANEIIDY
jgi:hypothetical protein